VQAVASPAPDLLTSVGPNPTVLVSDRSPFQRGRPVETGISYLPLFHARTPPQYVRSIIALNTFSPLKIQYYSVIFFFSSVFMCIT
jgi:hypothetical protein